MVDFFFGGGGWFAWVGHANVRRKHLRKKAFDNSEDGLSQAIIVL